MASLQPHSTPSHLQRGDTGFTSADRDAFQAWITSSSFRMIVTREQYNERVRVLRTLDEGRPVRDLVRSSPNITRMFVYKTRYDYSLSRDGTLLYHARSQKGPLHVVCMDRIFDVVVREHNSIEHQGMNKTWSEIAPRYQGIPREAVNWIVKRCSICHSQLPNSRALFDAPITSEKPMERIQMDLIDMRLCPDRQYRWVLHIKDHFSRFCMLFPVSDRTSMEVANHFMTWIAFMGTPEILQTDNGIEFTGAVARIAEQYGTNVVRGRPLVPRTQGLVERANGHVRRLISKWCKRNHRDDWTASLAPIAFACNVSIHSSTRLSPFEVVFGRKPRKHAAEPTNDVPQPNRDAESLARITNKQSQEHMVRRTLRRPIFSPGTSVSISCAGPAVHRQVTDDYRIPGIVVGFEPPLGYRICTVHGVLDRPVCSRRVRALESSKVPRAAVNYARNSENAPQLSMQQYMQMQRLCRRFIPRAK